MTKEIFGKIYSRFPAVKSLLLSCFSNSKEATPATTAQVDISLAKIEIKFDAPLRNGFELSMAGTEKKVSFDFVDGSIGKVSRAELVERKTIIHGVINDDRCVVIFEPTALVHGGEYTLTLPDGITVQGLVTGQQVGSLVIESVGSNSFTIKCKPTTEIQFMSL